MDNEVTEVSVTSSFGEIYTPDITNFSNWYTGTSTTWPVTWSYTNTIYMYQIKCPKRSCKKMNWLELDKITPCTECGAKLKAVSEQAEFEIEVN